MNPSEVIQMMGRLTDYLGRQFPLSEPDADYAAMKLIEDGWVVSDPQEESN